MPVRIHIRDNSNDAWKARALCATGGYPADLWFPASYVSADGILQTEAARRICAACPVAELCRAAAVAREGTVSLDRRDGIWGGTTPQERYNAVKHEQALRRKQLAAAA